MIMSCMVCRKSDVRLFNVGSIYGTINHTVGDDFMEIYGQKVEFYLTPESCVCNVCMNILDNVAKLIRYIWNVISDPCSQPHPSKLSKFWKMFALKLEGDDIENIQIQDSGNGTPSPNLLVPSYSVPYNKNLEAQIDQRERGRVSSRAKPVNNTSKGQNIVSNRKAKKKGGRTRSRVGSTSSGYGRSRSRLPECDTPYSEYSNLSSYTVNSTSKRKLRSLSADSTKSKTCTRSVSRAIEEETRFHNRYLTCSERNCNMFSDDIEEMNLHNIQEHAMSVMYHCHECSNAYTTNFLYNHHMKYHNFSFFCLMCGEEKKNSFELQQHLDEHMRYSVECKYCDKSFLSQICREEHIKQSHKGKRKRRIYKKKLILDRIDKNDRREEPTNGNTKEYEVRYMFYTNIEREEGDTDMTIENLKMKGIPIYTDEDENIVLRHFDIEESECSETEIPQTENIELEEAEMIAVEADCR